MPRNSNKTPHILLITGQPGIGKTTVVRRVADRLGPSGLRGIYTEEITVAGERRGFRWLRRNYMGDRPGSRRANALLADAGVDEGDSQSCRRHAAGLDGKCLPSPATEALIRINAGQGTPGILV